MLEVMKNLGNGVTLRVSGANQLEVFEQLAVHTEIFGVKECGCCQSGDIKHVVRHVDDPDPKKKKTYTYYELHCNQCRAKLAFGCKQDAEHLFPKRKDADDKYLPNNGWVKYVKPE